MNALGVMNNELRMPWRHALAAFSAFFILYALFLYGFANPILPQHDALRYIDYILNLNIHGVFGLSYGDLNTAPQPGRANAPIYMMLVAAVSAMDAVFQDSLHCIITTSSAAEKCALNLNSLYLLNAFLGAATIVVGMAIAHRLTQHLVIAWLTGLIVLAFLVKVEDGLRIAPENAMLLPFFISCWAMLKFQSNFSVSNAFLLGASLAATTLIRPSYLYLFYGYVFGFIGLAAFTQQWSWLKGAGAVVAGFAAAAGPWALRNLYHFGDLALSGGQYAELIIAQRLAYHMLDWRQIAIAFVYWTPDFGDQLAKAIASPETLALLGTGPASIYHNAIDNLYNSTVSTLGGKEGVLRHLIVHNVLLEPVKFAALTAVFIWRGIFVAKILGMIGVVCTVICIRHTLLRRDWRLLVLLAPMAFMVLFHAAISISIARYNLFLILPYSLCIAWVLQETTALLARTWHKHGKRHVRQDV